MPCRNPKGFKTDHPGYGLCAFCFGATPNGMVHAMREKATVECAKRGIPIVVDPHTALLHQVHRAAGWVEFYEGKLRALPSDDDLVWGISRREESTPTRVEPTGGGDEPRAHAGNAFESNSPERNCGGGDSSHKGNGNIRQLEVRPETKIVSAAEASVWYKNSVEMQKILILSCKTAIDCGIASRLVELAEGQAAMIRQFAERLVVALGLDPGDDHVRSAIYANLLALSEPAAQRQLVDVTPAAVAATKKNGRGKK